MVVMCWPARGRTLGLFTDHQHIVCVDLVACAHMVVPSIFACGEIRAAPSAILGGKFRGVLAEWSSVEVGVLGSPDDPARATQVLITMLGGVSSYGGVEEWALATSLVMAPLASHQVYPTSGQGAVRFTPGKACSGLRSRCAELRLTSIYSVRRPPGGELARVYKHQKLAPSDFWPPRIVPGALLFVRCSFAPGPAQWCQERHPFGDSPEWRRHRLSNAAHFAREPTSDPTRWPRQQRWWGCLWVGSSALRRSARAIAEWLYMPMEHRIIRPSLVSHSGALLLLVTTGRTSKSQMLLDLFPEGWSLSMPVAYPAALLQTTHIFGRGCELISIRSQERTMSCSFLPETSGRFTTGPASNVCGPRI